MVINSRRTGFTGHEAHMVERKNMYRFFIWKSERKTPVGLHRLGWENNIKMNLKEI
jgi:hypothetical protein